MTALPRRTCAWCGRSVPVRRNGAFREHTDGLATGAQCIGSGLMPEEADMQKQRADAAPALTKEQRAFLQRIENAGNGGMSERSTQFDNSQMLWLMGSGFAYVEKEFKEYRWRLTVAGKDVLLAANTKGG